MASSSGAPRVPVEERLFSLVLALLATETGLTKAEILSTVQGYRQKYTMSGDNSNLERQFERDKDDIRELGVPLEAIAPLGEEGNNHNLRYRIPRGQYELPDDITFTPEEATLLNLAAMVWREGSVSAESRRALLKLRALGAGGGEPVLAYAPRLRARDDAFDPLRTALDKRVLVEFSYLKPGETMATARRVAPLALVQHQGRWHLYTHEPASDFHKTFLLRRIVSAVKITTVPHTADELDYSAIALGELDELWVANTATVRVQPGSDAATRLLKRRGTSADGDDLAVHYTDLNILADELAGFGPEAVVLAPAELRTAVHARLETVVNDHG